MYQQEKDCFGIDTRLVVKTNTRASSDYHRFSEVCDIIADRMYERLGLLSQSPKRILDLGTGDGRHLSVLKKMFPSALVVGADICHQGLASCRQQRSLLSRVTGNHAGLVCLDAAQPQPFESGAFDLIVSNLLLPWVHPCETFAKELNRLLSSDGAFFVSSVGPDTLIELRHAWQQIDSAEHVNAFLDMHDLGDVLHGAGITDPVMDTERLQVSFTSVHKLLDELVHTGCTNVLYGRRRGLTSADVRDRLASHYSSAPAGEVDEEKVYATLEVVYAHGWKGKPVLPAGQQVVNLDSLRKKLAK